MSDEETTKSPDWYDESKVIRAIYAIEGDGGHSAYGGYVQDLGDGTCRFTNAPMMGEDGPEWGDRVDLFYNPCEPFGRPMVGYRVYPEGVEPTGRSFGLKREPDEEEQKEWDEKQERREKAELEQMDRHFEAMGAPLKTSQAEMKTFEEIIRYHELKQWACDQGLKIPEDLHSKPREKEEVPPEGRREAKLHLLAIARADYPEFDISEEEIQAEVERQACQDAEIDAMLKTHDAT